MSILKVNNVSYRYSDADADDYVLNNINLSFELGKSYAIKGKSGSGKTTLLSLISGLEKKYEGEILYDGKDLSKMVILASFFKVTTFYHNLQRKKISFYRWILAI